MAGRVRRQGGRCVFCASIAHASERMHPDGGFDGLEDQMALLQPVLLAGEHFIGLFQRV